ncbi:MAG: class I SAM-dependent methyltransferase [Acutalibacteraceae bacterium]
MRFSTDFGDYRLLDASCGERLEDWGGYILIRPDPQVIWQTPKTNPLWNNADAVYSRSKSGGGSWSYRKKLPDVWNIRYKDLTFRVKPMGFKHTGLFPEQAVNWDYMRTLIFQNSDFRVLNLFAYTGGATVAALKAGAAVTHVDASKGMVSWAKENAEASGVLSRPVRWIVDDCVKFVKREVRRGNVYNGIILDPPSYGRGPGGEIWRLEDELYPLIEECSKLLNEDSRFVILNSYTTGLSASVMEYILKTVVRNKLGGEVFSDEIGLPVQNTDLVLPCGATSVWIKNE